MRQNGVGLRPGGCGLANRGQEMPPRKELNDLVHVQHLSYREIAAIYGVDASAIPHWLDRYDIDRADVWVTRRKGRPVLLPTAGELRHRRSLGESATSIAASYKVSRTLIAQLCKSQGIPLDLDGWQGGRRYACRDGHQARSLYEQRVDDWLAEHGIGHIVEPRYPFDARYKADFLVDRFYIEVWGVTNNPAYQERKRKKIRLCEENSLPLIQINHWQFAKGRRWWKPLQKLLDDLTPKSIQLAHDLWDIPIERGA